MYFPLRLAGIDLSFSNVAIVPALGDSGSFWIQGLKPLPVRRGGAKISIAPMEFSLKGYFAEGVFLFFL
ncbi:MAG: hypothetical protein CL555_17110 [Algoriphagus sp.]|nr:hypothetical protein [Algoriphagus sp.]